MSVEFVFDRSLAPILQFEKMLSHAREKAVPEYDAFTLSTSDHEGRVSARVLYMKELTQDGLVFYTNYLSYKSQQMRDNSQVCANFFWPQFFQQVRITGAVKKVERSKSEEYFATRPRMSQIGAWASKQSESMPDYEHLIQRFAEYEKQFEGQEVPCPPEWGGYLLSPSSFEFWIGREGRLHERYCYEHKSKNQWSSFMRSP